MGEFTTLAHHNQLILFLPSKSNSTCLQSGVWSKCKNLQLGGRLHTVMSMTATQREGRLLLHHILVVVAVVCRVSLPAVLEVVSQHVVKVVLLLQVMGERH